MQIRPRSGSGANTADRAPTTTPASPEAIRSRSSRRSAPGSLERPRRRRAVVVGEPEGEVDQRGGDALVDALDRNRVDPGGRRPVDADDDAPPASAPETDADDGPLLDSVRDLVRERPGDRAGG